MFKQSLPVIVSSLSILAASVAFAADEAPSFAETDFAPFPLDQIEQEVQKLVPDFRFQMHTEYTINACSMILHSPDVTCVPTSRGGFILVPVGGGLQGIEDFLGRTIVLLGKGTNNLGELGLVVDDGSIINIPPRILPLVREYERQ